MHVSTLFLLCIATFAIASSRTQNTPTGNNFGSIRGIKPATYITPTRESARFVPLMDSSGPSGGLSTRVKGGNVARLTAKFEHEAMKAQQGTRMMKPRPGHGEDIVGALSSRQSVISQPLRPSMEVALGHDAVLPRADPKDFLQRVESPPFVPTNMPEITTITTATTTPPEQRKRRILGIFRRKEKTPPPTPSPTPMRPVRDRMKEMQERMVFATEIPVLGASGEFGRKPPKEFLSPLAQEYVRIYGASGSPLLQAALERDMEGKEAESLRRSQDARLSLSGSRRMGNEYNAYTELRMTRLQDRIKYRLGIYTADRYHAPDVLHPHCKRIHPDKLRIVCVADEAPLVLSMDQASALETILASDFPHTHVSAGSMMHPSREDIQSRLRVAWNDRLFAEADYFTINVGDGCAYRNERYYTQSGDDSKVCWTIVAKNSYKMPRSA